MLALAVAVAVAVAVAAAAADMSPQLRLQKSASYCIRYPQTAYVGIKRGRVEYSKYADRMGFVAYSPIKMYFVVS